MFENETPKLFNISYSYIFEILTTNIHKFVFDFSAFRKNLLNELLFKKSNFLLHLNRFFVGKFT